MRGWGTCCLPNLQLGLAARDLQPMPLAFFLNKPSPSCLAAPRICGLAQTVWAQGRAKRAGARATCTQLVLDHSLTADALHALHCTHSQSMS